MIRRVYFAAVVALCCSGDVGLAKDIVATAVDAGNFNTLLKAATAAGMTEALKGPGPFTVYAPTDAAFAALPPGELDRLMEPENKQELGMVLGYHVLTGRLVSADVTRVVGDGTKKAAAATIIGPPVTLSKVAAGLMVNDANITMPDVKADNGIIQVIDKVLMPAMAIQPDL